jgi:hypothetical protein
VVDWCCRTGGTHFEYWTGYFLSWDIYIYIYIYISVKLRRDITSANNSYRSSLRLSTWRQAAQFSPLLQLALSRGIRVVVGILQLILDFYLLCLKEVAEMSSFGSQTCGTKKHVANCTSKFYKLNKVMANDGPHFSDKNGPVLSRCRVLYIYLCLAYLMTL